MSKGKATIMKYATKGGGKGRGEQNKIAATVGDPDSKGAGKSSGGNTGDACMGMGKGCGCKGVCGCKF